MPVWTVVVAAGSGTRFGGPKQYQALGPVRVLDHSLAAARHVSDGLVLVVPPDRVGEREPDVDAVVAGGATRSESVRRGLASVPEEATVILIHDAARPLAGSELFARVVAAVRAGADAVVPVVPVVDTLRTAPTDGAPTRTVDRSSLVAVQTPQGFTARALRDAHAAEPEGTDDASLVEAAGGRVELVAGAVANRKITDPIDLVLAEALLDRGGR